MTEPAPTIEPPASGTAQPRRAGAEMASTDVPALRAAFVALVAGGAVALSAVHPVQLLVVIATVQVAFVLAWVLGAPAAVGPGGSVDGPDDEVRTGRRPLTDGGGPAAAAMPGRTGAVLIGVGAAAATDFAVMRWPHSALSPMLGILGLAVPVMFTHQLIRGVVRARVVESLSGIALIVAAVAALPALLQLRHEIGGDHLVAAAALAGGVAVAVGLLVDLVWSRPRFDPDVPRGLSAVVLAAVAGGLIGAHALGDQPQFSFPKAVLYCTGTALVSALVAVAASMIGYSSPTTGPVTAAARLLRPVALALLPLMLVSPAAYVLLLSA